jgi:hypothetical protein
LRSRFVKTGFDIPGFFVSLVNAAMSWAEVSFRLLMVVHAEFCAPVALPFNSF